MPLAATIPIDLIVLALAALVVIIANPIITKVIAAVFSKIPIVGNYIRVGVDLWWQLTIWPITWFFGSMLGPLTSQFHQVAVGWVYMWNVIGNTARQVDLAADHIRNVVIPRIYNAATGYAAYLVNGLLNYTVSIVDGLRSYTVSLINGMLAYVNSEVASARAYAGQLINGLLAYTVNLINGLYAYTVNLVNGLLSYVNTWINTVRADLTSLRSYVDAKWADLFHTVEADIATAEQRAEALALQYAKTALIDALGITDQAAVKALSDIWPHLATDLDAIEHAIPAELTDIKDLILSIPRAVPQSLVDALSALGALAVPLIRYLEDCGIPLCQNLHGLSDLVNSLESAAVDAALIALFAEMVSNPHDAADAILTVVAPIADASASATRSLIGV
jgi:hypothetical protein